MRELSTISREQLASSMKVSARARGPNGIQQHDLFAQGFVGQGFVGHGLVSHGLAGYGLAGYGLRWPCPNLRCLRCARRHTRDGLCRSARGARVNDDSGSGETRSDQRSHAHFEPDTSDASLRSE